MFIFEPMEKIKTNPNDAINAIVQTINDRYGNTGLGWVQMGLTKREYFAVMAMQGFISNPNNKNWVDFHPRNAVEIADQLIEELNK